MTQTAPRPVNGRLRAATEPRREIHSWLMDMDGVLVHEDQAIPGAERFIDAPP